MSHREVVKRGKPAVSGARQRSEAPLGRPLQRTWAEGNRRGERKTKSLGPAGAGGGRAGWTNNFPSWAELCRIDFHLGHFLQFELG